VDDVIQVLNPNLISQLQKDCVHGKKLAIPGQHESMFVVNKVWAMWLNVWEWIVNADNPGVLAADDLGFGKRFPSVSVTIICKLMSELVVLRLPQLY